MTGREESPILSTLVAEKSLRGRRTRTAESQCVKGGESLQGDEVGTGDGEVPAGALRRAGGLWCGRGSLSL